LALARGDPQGQRRGGGRRTDNHPRRDIPVRQVRLDTAGRSDPAVPALDCPRNPRPGPVWTERCRGRNATPPGPV
jgi:hypothetical protein